MSIYQKIYNRLRQAGMTDAVTLGFLGNWQQESGCEPIRIQNDFDPFRIASKTYTSRVESGEISRQEFGRDQKGYGLAQCANGFDMTFLRCGDVTVQINDTENPYTPKAYNTNLTVG